MNPYRHWLNAWEYCVGIRGKVTHDHRNLIMKKMYVHGPTALLSLTNTAYMHKDI